ncbi:MAG: hypothetical protein ACR2MC_00150 [Actinomycetota bacterium]
MPSSSGDHPAGGGEQNAVVGLEAGAADLTFEDFELMAQDHELECLGISRPQAPDDESQD